jgi:hypothetical protein
MPDFITGLPGDFSEKPEYFTFLNQEVFTFKGDFSENTRTLFKIK